MAWDITGATLISVLPPFAPNVIWLLMDGRIAMAQEPF